MKKLLQFAAGLMLVAQFAVAQESRTVNDGGTNDFSGTLAAAKNLRVNLDAGSVRVEGGDQREIRYEVRNRRDSSDERSRSTFNGYRITANVKGDTAYIVGEWQGGSHRRFSGDFSINVPRDIESVSIQTDGGGVTLLHLGGRAEIETGGGAVRVEDVKGAVHAQTGGDNMDIASVGGDLNLQTGGGKISLRDIRGSMNASTGGGDVLLISSQKGGVLETGGGNIQVQQCGGKLRVSTGGGNIDIGDVAGAVEIETGGGSIRVGSAKGFVRAETGAGRIELNGIPGGQAETGSGTIVAKLSSMQGVTQATSLETGSGDVVVYLDPALHISVRAAIDMANGHTISSDFPEIKVVTEGGEWGPQSVSANGGLNGGGPMLKMSTASGNIQIKRASR